MKSPSVNENIVGKISKIIHLPFGKFRMKGFLSYLRTATEYTYSNMAKFRYRKHKIPAIARTFSSSQQIIPSQKEPKNTFFEFANMHSLCMFPMQHRTGLCGNCGGFIAVILTSWDGMQSPSPTPESTR